MTKLQELRELILRPKFKELSEEYPDRLPDSFVYSINLPEVLVELKNYSLFKLHALDNHCKIRVFVGYDNKKLEIYNEIIWDLTKDLDGQSPETIESLLKLLKGE